VVGAGTLDTRPCKAVRVAPHARHAPRLLVDAGGVFYDQRALMVAREGKSRDPPRAMTRGVSVPYRCNV
jgi:hypothetical protein